MSESNREKENLQDELKAEPNTAEENENLEDLEMDDDLIVFETEDGEEVTFVIEDYFYYNGDEYAILTEYDPEKGEIIDEGSIVCKVEPVTGPDGEEDDEFIPVEDDALAEKLIEIANIQLGEDEEEE